MSLVYERVRLEHLGAGGRIGDSTLVETVEAALDRLSTLVVDDRATGPGMCTVKIKVAKTGEESVLITYSVSTSDPKTETKGLSAIVDTMKGEIHAAHHKQESLDLPRAEPLRAVNGHDDDDEVSE